MTSIAIARFNVRYRMPPGAIRTQPRLQQIVVDALERVLEGALERAGVGRDGFVCIRRLHTAVRLRLREPDSLLAAGFGEGLADAIVGACERPSASIVVYRSRAQAVIDLAGSAVTGDFDRSWAWSQVGIWRDTLPAQSRVAVEAVLRALAAKPREGVAILADVARSRVDAFALLIARATPAAWIALARAATLATGGSPDLLDQVAGGPETTATVVPGDFVAGTRSGRSRSSELDMSPAPFNRLRVVERSAIARALVDRLGDLPARSVVALVALALLEVDPAAVRGSAERVRLMLAQVERELRAVAATAGSVPREAVPVAGRPKPGNLENVGQRSSDTARNAWSQRGAPNHGAPTTEHARAAQNATPGAASVDAPSPPAIDDVRRHGSTRFGGLLYLINVAEDMGLPETLLRDDRLNGRGLRWPLHQIAMLLGTESSDPAALAFAGLPPDEQAPASQQEPPGETELGALREHCAALVRAVQESLERHADPEDEVIRFVCERRARIVADPGWIELQLSVEDVSIDIRRAGLDRDPGWVPWLGIVVRFRYA